ncbi:MAG TPA: TorF family putative porin [Hyphomicrobiales bacterium]|nr:TorF family putative porin [Hyphomicrobiales bacterium]
MNKLLPRATLAIAVSMVAVTGHAADLTANASITNNYLWRGLTQTMNEPAVQGGLDLSSDSGLYAGTWISNVEFDPGDVFSYEHDMYFGFAGESGGFGYDVGYLYYNYDSNASFDFGELYLTLSFGNFSLSGNFLTNTEADEAPGQDFSAFETYYLAGGYTIPLASGAEISLHLGYHDGDFAEAFNGVTDSYFDFNIALAKDGFTFMVSKTSLGSDDDGDGIEDYASMSERDNDEVKFVVSYGLDFQL